MAPTLAAKRSLVFLVAPLLLMALLTAASPVAAGRAGGGFHIQFQQDADGGYCGRVRVCKEDLCSATCAVLGVAGVGQCKVVGGEPTCCCVVVPTKPSATVGLQSGAIIDPKLA